MNDGDAQRQINQMVAFILQEAREKAQELAVRTEHDFALEKQKLVLKGKERIDDEYTRKEKDIEVQKRIDMSRAVGEQMAKKMQIREELLQSVLEATKVALARTSDDKASYKALLKQLILQGLVTLHEKKIIIQCRASDVALCKEVVGDATEEFKRLMKEEAGKDMSDIAVIVNEKEKKHLPPAPSAGHVGPACSGGVLLVAHKGRILCDNTLDTRLQLCFEQMKPALRNMLFPQSIKA
eukprot:CAMPEP_0196782644 /NCGR_PEP_ID=MMETSP1104-20130614/11768_1 /TAXON_ID=33652 /ORGANISM="Cafeteria sp., Strain Caron Lab Isolate" /LENGTH=238 /DNA_ID=CAMNT_0042152887 /DNA_START=34 /DNA_END=750 /DNA_ORIENTATION=+